MTLYSSLQEVKAACNSLNNRRGDLDDLLHYIRNRGFTLQHRITLEREAKEDYQKGLEITVASISNLELFSTYVGILGETARVCLSDEDMIVRNIYYTQLMKRLKRVGFLPNV